MCLRVLSRRDLADSSRRSNPNSRTFTVLRTLCRSCKKPSHVESSKYELFHQDTQGWSYPAATYNLRAVYLAGLWFRNLFANRLDWIDLEALSFPIVTNPYFRKSCVFRIICVAGEIPDSGMRPYFLPITVTSVSHSSRRSDVPTFKHFDGFRLECL